MAVVTSPIALQNAGATHTAEQLRAAVGVTSTAARAASSLTPRGGVHPALGGQLRVHQQAAPTTGVLVEAGLCLVPGSENTKQGCYTVMNDAALNVAMTAAPGSNSRIDTIVVRIQDQVYSGASNTATIESVTGTAAASPSPPALPNNCLALADVLIPALDTQYTDSQITDRRTYLGGGLIICGSSADYPTVVYTGLAVYDMLLSTLLVWDGAGWAVPGSTAPWTTFPFAAGYQDASGTSGSYPAQYRRVGNRVEMRGSVRNTGGTNMSTGGNFTIGTMPVGTRPAATTGHLSWGMAQFGTANPPLCRREIQSTGVVQFNAMYTATWVSLDGIWYYTS